MKYILLIDRDPSIEASAGGELDRLGARVIGGRLGPRDASNTVSARAGQLAVTDGPFAEAKEVFAGFDVVECGNLDDAIEVASKHPIADHGSIEIRPFWPLAKSSEVAGASQPAVLPCCCPVSAC